MNATVAIRGSGAIGLRHARVFESLGVRVVVVPERPERVPEIEAMGLLAAVSIADLPTVDGVVVCTRTAAHRIPASELRAPLLVEKPLATNARIGDQILIGAAEAGQSVHVAYCLRFNPGIRFIADQLSEIGQVDAVDAECFSWLPSWRLGRDYRTTYSASSGEGGVMLDLSHEVDLVNHLLGPGQCIGAIVDGARLLDLGANVDESAVLMTDHGGVRATIRLSFARRPESRRLRVFGRNGCLEWDAIARTARHVDSDGTVVASVSWADASGMYFEQAKSWLAVLRGESGGPLATGQQGIQALRIVDDARTTSWHPHRTVETVCAS